MNHMQGKRLLQKAVLMYPQQTKPKPLQTAEQLHACRTAWQCQYLIHTTDHTVLPARHMSHMQHQSHQTTPDGLSTVANTHQGMLPTGYCIGGGSADGTAACRPNSLQGTVTRLKTYKIGNQPCWVKTSPKVLLLGRCYKNNAGKAVNNTAHTAQPALKTPSASTQTPSA